jgi:hypothetical protein
MAKRIIYWTIIVLMAFPLLQYTFRLVKVKPLDGAFYLTEKPKFIIENWFTGEFQDGYVKHIEDHIGFREDFIRLNNQVFYSLFNIAKSPGAIVGKNKQLYLRSYIDGYLGNNFVGKEQIDEKLRRYQFISDYLSLYGKTNFLVFAPGKASFYPEYLPNEYDIQSKRLNNFEYYISACEQLGIDYIDLNAYFTEIKGKTKYKLYPQNGVHWTSYGMYLGVDSIIRYIENKRDINIPDIIIKDMIISDSIRHPDNDVEKNMNLICPIWQPSQVYPDFEFYSDSTYQKPRVIMISDSYYWQAYGDGIPQNCFEFGGFWFYFETAYNNGYKKGIPVDSLDIKEEFMKSEVIIVMGTEATSGMFPYGFVDKAYELYFPKTIQCITENYQWKIKNEPDWLESTIEKAKNRGNTLDEQIFLEADYMANIEYKKMPEIEKQIVLRYEMMLKDSLALNKLKKEAIELNVDYKALALYKAENEDPLSR